MIITVKHNFETAHRLPFLGGKCTNLHGHSWLVEWQFRHLMDADGITMEYGELKKTLRTWVDERLDHGTMLGKKDTLVPVLTEEKSKLFVFGVDYLRYPWPTVEAVAFMLADRATDLVGMKPAEVRVQETAVNAAIWNPAS